MSLKWGGGAALLRRSMANQIAPLTGLLEGVAGLVNKDSWTRLTIEINSIEHCDNWTELNWTLKVKIMPISRHSLGYGCNITSKPPSFARDAPRGSAPWGIHRSLTHSGDIDNIPLPILGIFCHMPRGCRNIDSIFSSNARDACLTLKNSQICGLQWYWAPPKDNMYLCHMDLKILL